MNTPIKTILKIFLLSACILSTSTVAALTSYTTDKVRVPIRGGKGLNHKIIKMIPSGLAVKILRKDKKSGYTYIQWAPKRRGWISNRLLMKRKPALIQLSTADKEIAALKKQIIELQKKKNTTIIVAGKPGQTQDKDKYSKSDPTKRENTAISNERAKQLTKQLETQGGALTRLSSSMNDIAAQNKNLLKKLDLTYQELKEARDKTGSFQASDSRKWFIWGAFLAGLAFFTGIGVTRIRWQRGSMWN